MRRRGRSQMLVVQRGPCQVVWCWERESVMVQTWLPHYIFSPVEPGLDVGTHAIHFRVRLRRPELEEWSEIWDANCLAA
jgi:hypothetical protein